LAQNQLNKLKMIQKIKIIISNISLLIVLSVIIFFLFKVTVFLTDILTSKINRCIDYFIKGFVA
jgi:phosphate starvation-inducible membrane PsiE